MSRKISKGKTKNTAAKETIYTVPTHQTALWTLLYVANIGANNKSAAVYWYDASTNEEYGIINTTFNTGTGLEWGGDGKYVVLEEGDEIRVEQQDNLTTFSFIISVELDPKIAVQFNT
jgi:hypothetical protein